MWRRVWQMACREEQIPDRRRQRRLRRARACRSWWSAARRDEHPRLSQLLPAPRHAAAHPTRSSSTSCGAPSTGSPGTSTGPSRACRVRGTSPTSTPRRSACPRPGWGCGAASSSSTVDPDAAPGLEEYLEILPEHFASWDLGERYLTRPRRARRPVQLEGGARGVHRELPHRGRPPPAAHDQRRHPDRVRRLRRGPPRQPDDHARRHRQRARRRRRWGSRTSSTPCSSPRTTDAVVPDGCQRPPGPGRPHPSAAGRAAPGGDYSSITDCEAARRHRVLRVPQLRAVGGLHDAARLPVPAPRRRPHRRGHGRHVARAGAR